MGATNTAGCHQNTRLDQSDYAWTIYGDKHEPLKNLAPGAWSHRITEEHRLVYLVTDDRVDFLQGRYHYTR